MNFKDYYEEEVTDFPVLLTDGSVIHINMVCEGVASAVADAAKKLALIITTQFPQVPDQPAPMGHRVYDIPVSSMQMKKVMGGRKQSVYDILDVIKKKWMGKGKDKWVDIDIEKNGNDWNLVLVK